MADEADETRAFVVVRHAGETWVEDLPQGEDVTVGSDASARLTLDASEIGGIQCTLRWDGKGVTLEDGPDGTTFLNGKRFDARAELKPGDELALGPVQMVIGLSAPLSAGGRRALTHHEFRERLYEELSRAARGNRPTALVMVQARTAEGGRITATALDSFRAGDMVATYASDEPEFLLPDTDYDTARTVVRRILDSASADATFGLAVAPADGENPERLLRAARDALHEALREGAPDGRPPANGVDPIDPVSRDPVTRELTSQVDGVAGTDASVLLIGENSTGKGVFARRLHAKSGRAQGPFVAVHCAMLTSDDDAKAAFGASGPARTATGGTLLLDEVGDLPPEGQRALVAFLEDINGDVRLVSTTQRTLAGLVERGAFDKDLHKKLTAEVIEVPALRSRPEDILPLAERFAEQAGANRPVRMSPGAVARLRSYPWPGNVLELKNAMERAVRLSRGGEILAEHLPSEPMPIASNEGRLREHVDGVERDAIIKALADSNHNQTHAARRLGISRRALIYKMEKYGLKRPPRTARKG